MYILIFWSRTFYLGALTSLTSKQVVQVEFWAEVASVVVDVHPFHCTSSLSVEFFLRSVGKEGSRQFDLH